MARVVGKEEDSPGSKDGARGGLAAGVHEHQHSSERGTLPHRYPQALVERSGAIYERHMKRMLDEIQAILLE